MKKLTAIMLAVLLAGVLASCRTGKTIHGDPCYTLSEAELTDMVAVARKSLRKPGKKLTPEEIRHVMNSEPEITVQYEGDCCGKVKVHWTLPDKHVSVIYSGLLDNPAKRETILEIYPNSDRIIYKGVPGHKDTPSR